MQKMKLERIIQEIVSLVSPEEKEEGFVSVSNTALARINSFVQQNSHRVLEVVYESWNGKGNNFMVFLFT